MGRRRDLTGWTYGTQPTFPEWLAARRALNDQENDNALQLSKSEAQVLAEYFSGNMDVIDAAQALIKFSYGCRPLSEIRDTKGTNGISQRCHKHSSMLVHILADLPALHPQICDLVRAINTLRDNQLGLTAAQMTKVNQWREYLRLERFGWVARDSHDSHWTRDYKSWVNDNAYQACHSQRYEPDWAWLGKVHINETLQTRAEFAKPESRKQQFDYYVQGACYWLIRAGPLFCERSKTGDMKMGLSVEMWQDWKQRLQNLSNEAKKKRKNRASTSQVRYDEVTDETVEMIDIALRRMEDIQNLDTSAKR